MISVLVIAGAFFLLLPWWPSTDMRMRKLLRWLFVLVVARYMYWRVESALTLDWSVRAVLVGLYLAFEFWGLTRTMRDFVFYSQFKDRRAEADSHAGWFEKEAPFVDLLIPTYNESPEVLRRAIVGGLRQNYGRTRVWVLDDGRRPWAKEMTESRGARYLTRPDNLGYEAGNLNHALGVLSQLPEPSVFFAVVDCDFVSGRNFVRRSLSLMHDPAVAVVQTKQVYYNQDLFQYGMNAGAFLPDWLRYGFEVVLPSKEAYGSSHCCGTSFLARTQPFLDVGGFPTETLAEDQLATLALRANGHQTVYLSEGLTFGILAEGLSELLTQRFRWCLGVYQNLFTRWGPLSATPRPLWARLRGIEGQIFSPLSIIVRIVMHFLLCAYWFVGNVALPLPTDPNEFIVFFLPVFAVNTLGMLWLSRGNDFPILGDARLWVSCVALLRAMKRGLLQSKNFKFDVTDKNVVKNGQIVHWRVMWPLLVMILPMVLGLAYGTFSPYAPRATFGAYIWSLYAVSSVVLAAALCVEPPQRRCETRFPASEPIRIQYRGVRVDATALNLSMSGVLVRAALPDVPVLGERVRCSWQGLELEGELARIDAPNHIAIALEDGPDTDELCARLYSERYVPIPVLHRARVSWAMFRKMVWD